MRIDINLATRAYVDHRLVNRIAYPLLLVLLALCGWQLMRLSWNAGELGRLTSETRQLEARMAQGPAGVPANEITRQHERVRFYNEIIARKSYSWLALLDRLERATPEGIAVTQLTPDLKGRELRIQASAKSFSQVRGYIDRLEASGDFSQVTLLSHKDVTGGTSSSANRGVQFTIAARAVLP